MRYFSFAIADSMLPATCMVAKNTMKPDSSYFKAFFEAEVVSAVNPSHKATLDAAKARYGIDIPIPEKAPQVTLGLRDELLVMSVRGLPRLDATRHEYTEAEIASATFVFSHYIVTVVS